MYHPIPKAPLSGSCGSPGTLCTKLRHLRAISENQAAASPKEGQLKEARYLVPGGWEKGQVVEAGVVVLGTRTGRTPRPACGTALAAEAMPTGPPAPGQEAFSLAARGSSARGRLPCAGLRSWAEGGPEHVSLNSALVLPLIFSSENPTRLGHPPLGGGAVFVLLLI